MADQAAADMFLNMLPQQQIDTINAFIETNRDVEGVDIEFLQLTLVNMQLALQHREDNG